MATPRTSVEIRSENKVWQILELYILGIIFYNQSKEHIISLFLAQYYDAAEGSK